MYRVLASLLIWGFAASALGVALQNAVGEDEKIFQFAPHENIPAGHLAQSALVRTLVPKGQIIYYVLAKPEGWQSRFWERSLYPDRLVRISLGSKNLPAHTPSGEVYVISPIADAAAFPFLSRQDLPGFPGGIPLVFGRLKVPR